MAVWRLLREDDPVNDPGMFYPVVVDEGPPVVYDDWQDGYPDDLSGWGDDEANAVTAHWEAAQAADEPMHRSHACQWVPSE